MTRTGRPLSSARRSGIRIYLTGNDEIGGAAVLQHEGDKVTLRDLEPLPLRNACSRRRHAGEYCCDRLAVRAFFCSGGAQTACGIGKG
jgi:hypothetical protein